MSQICPINTATFDFHRFGQSIRPAPDLAEAEANHRIANNLSIVAAYLRLQSAEAAAQSRPIAPIDVRDMLREAAARIETIGRLHRRLAGAPGHGSVDLAGFLDDLCSDAAAVMVYSGAIAFRASDHAPCHVSQARVVPLALSVLEAVTNAMKYAHPAGVPGRIEVNCRPNSDGGVIIEVEDDGVGLPEGFDPSVEGGLGMKVLRSLVAQVGGRIKFQSGPLGLTVRLTAPSDPVRAVNAP